MARAKKIRRTNTVKNITNLVVVRKNVNTVVKEVEKSVNRTLPKKTTNLNNRRLLIIKLLKEVIRRELYVIQVYLHSKT